LGSAALLEIETSDVEWWERTAGIEDVWEDVCKEFTPRQIPKGLIWATESIVNEFGRPYDHLAYPHLGAPGGPWDSWDNSAVRTISMQFGTRLGKTFFGLCCALFTAANNPAPMMHANATEDLCINVMGRGYDIIERRQALRDLMESRHKTDWKQTEYRFKACKTHGAWARSVSTLADKDVLFGHAAEIDKWEHASTSKEAEPLDLFTDRFKNYQSIRKIIFESTPTIRGKSRIEEKLLAGSECRLWVPCHHCRKHQLLEVGNESTPWGLKFDRAPNGRSDPAIAFSTARYVCRHCQAELFDHDRAWMVRRGVWAPRGCEINSEPAIEAAESRMRPSTLKDEAKWLGWSASTWISGTPARDGPDQSYQLSSLYALSLSWGDIASAFVKVHDKPQQLRNFVNQWKAETWELKRRAHSAEELAERLCGTHRRGIIPDSCGVITIGIDVQEDHFVWVVVGWSEGDRGYVIDYGQIVTWEELRRDILSHRFPGDTMAALPIAMGGMDSGHRTDEVFGYCQEIGDALRPTKGFDSLEKPIVPSSLEFSRSETRRLTALAAKMFLWKFNKGHWQEELQRRLDYLKAGQAGSLSLPIEAAEDFDFLEQIANNAPVAKPNGRIIWEKIHESSPDDYRDALVIARVTKEMWTRGNESRVALAFAARERGAVAKKVAQAPPTPSPNRFLDRPGGWIEGLK